VDQLGQDCFGRVDEFVAVNAADFNGGLNRICAGRQQGVSQTNDGTDRGHDRDHAFAARQYEKIVRERGLVVAWGGFMVRRQRNAVGIAVRHQSPSHGTEMYDERGRSMPRLEGNFHPANKWLKHWNDALPVRVRLCYNRPFCKLAEPDLQSPTDDQ
jgi:hypothetical protein